MTEQDVIKAAGIRLGKGGHVSTKEGSGGWVEHGSDLFWLVTKHDKRGVRGLRVVRVSHVSTDATFHGYAVGSYDLTRGRWMAGRISLSVQLYSVALALRIVRNTERARRGAYVPRLASSILQSKQASIECKQSKQAMQ